jgi:hypothetical protein
MNRRSKYSFYRKITMFDNKIGFLQAGFQNDHTCQYILIGNSY